MWMGGFLVDVACFIYCNPGINFIQKFKLTQICQFLCALHLRQSCTYLSSNGSIDIVDIAIKCVHCMCTCLIWSHYCSVFLRLYGSEMCSRSTPL